jgi:hypothetical protein
VYRAKVKAVMSGLPRLGSAEFDSFAVLATTVSGMKPDANG